MTDLERAKRLNERLTKRGFVALPPMETHFFNLFKECKIPIEVANTVVEGSRGEYVSGGQTWVPKWVKPIWETAKHRLTKETLEKARDDEGFRDSFTSHVIIDICASYTTEVDRDTAKELAETDADFRGALIAAYEMGDGRIEALTNLIETAGDMQNGK